MNEAELLFTDLLSCNRSQLYLRRHTVLDRDKSNFISAVLKRRIKGEPIQYILNKADFMGFEFYVSPDVLIPRPETELLVEAAIRYLAPKAYAPLAESFVSRRLSMHILDLGTGSGCIAIILAKLIKDAEVTAADISKSALAVAKKNAELHKLSGKIKFIQSDLFKNLGSKTKKFDFIVSNPPYIPSGQIEKLQREVQFEPCLALDGGGCGLDYVKRIIKESPCFLKRGGLLIMEMGLGQAGKIKNVFSESKKFNIIDMIKDYNQIERVIVAKKR